MSQTPHERNVFNPKLHIEVLHKKAPKGLQIFPGPEELQIGEHCSYKHIEFNNKNDISELKEKVNVLEKSIHLMSAQISDLTDKVANIKKRILRNTGKTF